MRLAAFRKRLTNKKMKGENYVSVNQIYFIWRYFRRGKP